MVLELLMFGTLWITKTDIDYAAARWVTQIARHF
jgi:hypothetical protein